MVLVLIIFSFVLMYYLISQMGSSDFPSTPNFPGVPKFPSIPVDIWQKGARAEKDLARSLLFLGIPEDCVFSNLYIPTFSGFAQIDAVALSEAGVFVFEVKNYSGWIFGRGNHSEWTQVLNYGKEKHSFYNPVFQNQGHIKALRKYMPLYSVPIFSIIVFYGSCTLKKITNIPQNTAVIKRSALFSCLQPLLQPPSAPYDKYKCAPYLQKAQFLAENPELRGRHIENIKKRKNPPFS